MFQYVSNIAMQRYAIIDIADFFISRMRYIAEYCNILQCSTIGLSTQSKYASTIHKNFLVQLLVIHMLMIDTKHHLKTLMQY